MKLSTCILLLALVAAASATSARFKLRFSKKCGLLCGLTKKFYDYKPTIVLKPNRNDRSCLKVYNSFLFGGVSKSLPRVRTIYKECSALPAAETLDVGIGTGLNLSWGTSLIIEQHPKLRGVGVLFRGLLLALYKIIFCVSGSIKRYPGICAKDFGVKYGWPVYKGGYSSALEVIKGCGVENARARLQAIFKAQFGNSISGTFKVIRDCMYNLCSLIEKKTFVEKDAVSVIVPMVKTCGAVGSAYRAGTGTAVVDEFNSYYYYSCKTEINVDIREYTKTTKVELEDCDTNDFNAAFVKDDDVEDDNDEDGDGDGDDEK